MKRFLETLIFIPMFLLLAGNPAGASIKAKESVKWNSLNGLKKVHSHLMSNGHIIRLEFKKPVVDWVEPVFYEKSVQIDFPEAFVAPSKKSFSAESSLISKVFASQLDGETLRVRFHIKPGSKDIKERFKLVSQGRFIIVRFDSRELIPYPGPSESGLPEKKRAQKFEVMDDDELSRFLARASEKIKSRQEELPPRAETGSYPVAVKEPQRQESEVKIKRAGMGVAPLVDQIKKAALSDANADKKESSPKKPKTNTTKENTGFSLKGSRPAGKPMELVPSGMKMASMFAVVLGLIFLVFFGFKKYVLKNTAFGGGNKLVSVLGTWFLGPKKNIALIEVAGEVLVLGVSQENISLLSSITSEDKIEEIKNAGNKGKNGLGWSPNRVEEIKDKARAATEQAAGKFSSYLNKFSKPQEKMEQEAADAKEQILRKIGKLKTARA